MTKYKERQTLQLKNAEALIKSLHIKLPESGVALSELLSKLQFSMVMAAFKTCGYNTAETSKMLGLNRTTLVAILKKFCIVRPPEAKTIKNEKRKLSRIKTIKNKIHELEQKKEALENKGI